MFDFFNLLFSKYVLKILATFSTSFKSEYFIIPYTSTSIRFPHLCQGYHDHCIVTANDGGWEG